MQFMSKLFSLLVTFLAGRNMFLGAFYIEINMLCCLTKVCITFSIYWPWEPGSAKANRTAGQTQLVCYILAGTGRITASGPVHLEWMTHEPRK